MASINGGELLVKCLVNEGITKLFGIPGGQLTTIIDAVVRVGQPQGLEWVLTRHEASCANMADAWYRVTGDLAACTGTIGPGASNMVAGMEVAMADNSPLLAITPQIHSDRSYPFKGSQQQLDQVTLYSAVTKWNALVNRWDRIPDLVSMAVRQAFSGKPGPVHLDIPVDVLFETHDEDNTVIIPRKRAAPRAVPRETRRSSRRPRRCWSRRRDRSSTRARESSRRRPGMRCRSLPSTFWSRSYRQSWDAESSRRTIRSACCPRAAG